MQRISFVCLNAYKAFNHASSAQIGGTEVQMHAIARELSQDALYDVSFIVGDFGQNKKEQFNAIAVYASFALVQSTMNMLYAPFVLCKLLFRIRPHVIISSPAGPEIGIIALYCRMASAKFIFRTASDIDCNGQKELRMGVVSRILYRFGIADASAIVVQHARQQEDMKKFYRRESIIIQNGCAIPSRLPPSLPKRIIWIGSSRKVKRTDLFFEFAKQLPEYQFDMVLSRSGDQHIYDTSKITAKTMPNIYFHGELSPEYTNALLQKSYILIGTSDYEGSPNTYVMALAYGVPIVSLRVPCKGLYAEGSMKTMKEYIQNLMVDDAMYKNIRSAGYVYAKTHYDIKNVIQDWISVIRTTSYSR